jgi:hypothetical protein
MLEGLFLALCSRMVMRYETLEVADSQVSVRKTIQAAGCADDRSVKQTKTREDD